MTQKKPSLASFVAKTTKAPAEPVKKDSKTGTKHVTLRLTREQWMRVSKLALESDESIQGMCLQDLSRRFTDRGLPPL
ncbi:hypothetical protein [Serratia nevei]|jgi:hypothetical protein|uniref:hypothetical protein n=1 Tax=Serratia nevei TaxID=2703794 RepID=UPI00254C246F|nr:hypothetical protein [Serratia nevei]MDK5165529.1 hypothetical protein [Serratia nevei]